MKDRKRFIFPAFFALSITALLMKKFMVPFHGLFLIVVFDGMAILYFFKAFRSEKIEIEEVPRGRSFNFDIGSFAYAVCCIAILYRLEYWDGWEYWMYAAGILFMILSILTIFSLNLFFKLPEIKKKMRIIISGHLSWMYFLLLIPVFVFTNPRTFHNLFNGTTYEEYVRAHFPIEEGTSLIELYKPEDEQSKECAKEFFEEAQLSEKKGEYNEALIKYNKSIDLNPYDALSIYNRGRLKLTKLEIEKDMAESAYNDFSRAIQLDSTLAVAYYHRSVAWNYLYPKNRIPSREDLIKAQGFDTNLRSDRYVKGFLALPLVDSTTDTTTYVTQDE